MEEEVEEDREYTQSNNCGGKGQVKRDCIKKGKEKGKGKLDGKGPGKGYYLK
mgnify:CR=1 FL=1